MKQFLGSVLIFALVAEVSQGADTMLAPTALEAAQLRTIASGIAEDATQDAEVDGRETRIFRVTAREQEFYAAQVILRSEGKISAGDTLAVTFDARTTSVRDESGQGLLTVYFQESAAPGNKDLLRPVPLTDEWTTYCFAFRAKSSTSPDSAAGELGFGFGGREQTLELANVSLANHGPNVPLESLPQTRATYAGREPDAAWRADAAGRIDRIRKADLQVEVTDSDGQPISGASVKVEQQSHAFTFGSAVSVKKLNEQSPDGDRYREMVVDLFNHAVIESALKWPYWSETEDLTGDGTIEGALEWVRGEGLRVKGHVLIWPGFRKMPPAIEDLKNDPAALRAAIANRITGTAGKYRKFVDEWDVINEPFDNHDVADILGDEILAEWFNLAKEASPDTALYINDYGILTGGDANNTPHRQHYEDTIAALLDAQAPVEGIGMQGHFGEHLTPPTALYEVLNRFARFGLPIQVTEFDIDTTDQTLQADYAKDFLTLIFSHPGVTGFFMWGFWEGQHWRPAAAMFTKDWTPKPMAKTYRDLVFSTWWTKEAGETSASGEFGTRGFLGDYRITVEHEGQKVTREFGLTSNSPRCLISIH